MFTENINIKDYEEHKRLIELESYFIQKIKNINEKLDEYERINEKF